jgi:hypothetical protein
MLTIKILANNQVRFKHSVGVRPRPSVDPDVSNRILLRSVSAPQSAPHSPLVVSAPLPSPELSSQLSLFAPFCSLPIPVASEAPPPPLTILQNIKNDNAVSPIPCPDSSLAFSKPVVPSLPDIFPGHSNWGRRQKPKKFRSFARDSISEACCVLDRLYARENLRFVTLTLPGSRFECLDVLSRYSGFLINRLRQVFRDSGIESHDCFVWELQKRGALHLHWVIGSSDPSFKFLNPADVLSHRLKDKWYELLLEIGDIENIDMFARKGFGGSHKDNPTAWQWKIEEIRKSVQRYLSKYTSKGFNQNSGKTQSYTKIQARFSPSRWWGQSRNLLKEVRKYRVELKFNSFDTEQCQALLDNIIELTPKDTISFFYHKEWFLDDIGVSGMTAGLFIESSCYLEVLGKIAPIIWDAYALDREMSASRSSWLAAGLSGYASVVGVKERYQSYLDEEAANQISYKQDFLGDILARFREGCDPRRTPKTSPILFSQSYLSGKLEAAVSEFGF